MLKTTSLIGLSTISQLLIDAVDKNKIGRDESGGNKTNLSNLSASKKSTKTGYLTLKNAKKGSNNSKKGGGNTKKGITATKSFDYLTPGTKKTFKLLSPIFIQAPILQHFDLKRHIRIETDALGYVIGEVLNQPTLDDLRQWHLVAHYLYKMIPAKTWYKTHNGGLLAIVEAFKTWQHYLKSCKHKILVLTNHNNLWCFINTESLSFFQVCWAQ